MKSAFFKSSGKFYGKRALKKLGVTVFGDGVCIEKSVVLHRGATVFGPCLITGRSTVSSGARLFPGCTVQDSFIGEGATVRQSTLIGAKVGKNSCIGPYAYLRQGADIGEDCRVGDFVEIKNARLGKGSKAAHLAYIGDACIGSGVNIGCGVVFVNYDGKTKQRSVVEDGSFIGSNCNIVAPVHIGKGAYIAAGTTLTCDLREGDFCIGRSREKIKPHGAAGRYGNGQILRD